MADEISPISVDIISDVMCPWCYVGKRRFEKALKLQPHTKVDVKWRPYQLDPTIPKDGVDRQEYLNKKFGGEERAREIYQAIVDAGELEDIPFAFDRIKRSPNTLDAHRLIRWAFTPGLQDEMVEHLFRLYFIEGANIGDHDVLLDAARHVGMDMEILNGLMNSDADTELVEKEIALAREMGVQGVPCFIVANKYAVMGAEQPEVIAHALGLASEEQSSNDEPAEDAPAG